MPAGSRLTDIWSGVCTQHSGSIPMTGTIIGGSEKNKSGKLGQATTTCMTIGECGHVGQIVTGSPSCKTGGLEKAVVGSQIVGSNIGTVISGSSNHNVCMRLSSENNYEPLPYAKIVFEDEVIEFTEVDFATLTDDADTDDGLNIYPSISTIGGKRIREPTVYELIRSEQLAVPETETVEEDTTQPEETPPEEVTCMTVPTVPPSTFVLTPNFNLGNLSTHAVISHYQVMAQQGLSVSDLVCNLQALAENILEPISTQYGRTNLIITSGFRLGSSTSQHEKGQAVDIQFPKFSNTQIYNICQWIRDQLPTDQMILEYGGNRPWIHVSFNRFGNRPITAANKFGTRISVGNYVWRSLINKA